MKKIDRPKELKYLAQAQGVALLQERKRVEQMLQVLDAAGPIKIKIMKKKKIYKAISLVAAIYCGTIASNGDIGSWGRLTCAILCGCFAAIFVLLKD